MPDPLDLKDEYLPISKAARRAEHLVLQNRYQEALDQIDELRALVAEKVNG